MAIYHCSVKIIGRSSGRSAVAAAAYRSGEDMLNEYDGLEHDYTQKNWIEYSEIMLPDNAPKEYKDRNVLWNAVENIEKAANAQLAREFELALPVEFTKEQQKEVIRNFIRNNLTAEGMIIDFSIHNPPLQNDRNQPIDENGNITRDISKMQFINPHVHMLAIVRPLDAKGNWERKSEIEYICRCGEEEKAFTAAEYKIAKEEGWEKQYKFIDGKKKIWLTMSEGERRQLERVNRTPKTTPYGRKNPKTQSWNSQEKLLEWRQQWEHVVNAEFERMRSDIRIDCRSYKDQGREDEIPTLHMGTSATNMERRAARELREGKAEEKIVRSEIGVINQQIKAHNKFVREMKAKLNAMAAKAKDFFDGIARKLEGIRAKLIGSQYEESVLSRDYNILASTLVPEGERLQGFRADLLKVTAANETAAKDIQQLQKAVKECLPHQILKKKELQKQIQEEQMKIEARTDFIKNRAAIFGYSSEADFKAAEIEYIKRQAEFAKLEETVNRIKKEASELLEEYEQQAGNIDEADMKELLEKQLMHRPEAEAVVQSELNKRHKQFDVEKFSNIKQRIDKLLEGKTKAYKKTVSKSPEHSESKKQNHHR